MSGSNGIDLKRAKWADWRIACVAGRVLIGRLRAPSHMGAARRLEPVYDFQSGFAPTPDGTFIEIHDALPMLALSVSGIDLPDHGVLLIPFEDLDTVELDGMEKIVDHAEKIRQKQRAQRAGIALAPAMPKLSR